MRPSNNLENNTLSVTYWRIQLGRITVQAHGSLEPPLEYNQDQYFWQIKVRYDFFNHFWGYIKIV